MALAAALLAAGPALPGDVDGSLDPTEAAREAARLYGEHDLEAAIDVLRLGVLRHGQDAQLHFILANALYRTGDWDGAILHYRRAAELRPDHPDTHLSLGYAYFHAERPEVAVQAWRRAVATSPAGALPRVSLAVGLERLGRIREARHHARSAQQIDPNLRSRLDIDLRWTQTMSEALARLLEAGESTSAD